MKKAEVKASSNAALIKVAAYIRSKCRITKADEKEAAWIVEELQARGVIDSEDATEMLDYILYS